MFQRLRSAGSAAEILPNLHVIISGHCELDMVILLDASGGVDPNFNKVKDMTWLLVSEVDSKAEMGVLSRAEITTISSQPHRQTYLNDNKTKTELKDIIDAMRHINGRIFTERAVATAEQSLDRNSRSTATRFIVIFVDGRITNSGRSCKFVQIKSVHMISSRQSI